MPHLSSLRTYFLVEGRGVAISHWYPGQKDALDALEAVEQQGHVATRIIAGRAEKGHRREVSKGFSSHCGAEMIEFAGSGIALIGAATEGVVARHLVQDRRPAANPRCKIVLQHDEPRRSPWDYYCQSRSMQCETGWNDVLMPVQGIPNDNLKRNNILHFNSISFL